MGFFAQAIPFTTQTRLTFDVVLPLWGHRGPPQPAGVWPLAPCERCPAPFCRRPAHVLDGVRGAAYQSVLAAEPSENTWLSDKQQRSICPLRAVGNCSLD